jgi:hypothetical protein
MPASPPHGAVWELIFVQGLGLHGDTEAGRGGRDVAALPHGHGIEEVLVEMVHILHHTIFE